jgi:hypothetical protein
MSELAMKSPVTGVVLHFLEEEQIAEMESGLRIHDDRKNATGQGGPSLSQA